MLGGTGSVYAFGRTAHSVATANDPDATGRQLVLDHLQKPVCLHELCSDWLVLNQSTRNPTITIDEGHPAQNTGTLESSGSVPTLKPSGPSGGSNKSPGRARHEFCMFTQGPSGGGVQVTANLNKTALQTRQVSKQLYDASGDVVLGGDPTRFRLTRQSFLQAFVRLQVQLIGFAQGDAHCVAVTDEGDVYVWGDNSYGQLGMGSTRPYDLRQGPLKVASLSGVVAVAAGRHHCVVLTADGLVYQWGRMQSTPRWVKLDMPAQGIAAAGDWTAAVTCEEGAVMAWGSSLFLPKEAATQPVALCLAGAVLINGGHHHMLMVAENGLVYGLGLNAHGQLGLESSDGSQQTQMVREFRQVCLCRDEQGKPLEECTGEEHIQYLSCCQNYSALVCTDGSVWVSGRNICGQLDWVHGRDEQDSKEVVALPRFTQLQAPAGVQHVFAGPSRLLCFVPTTLTEALTPSLTVPDSKQSHASDIFLRCVGAPSLTCPLMVRCTFLDEGPDPDYPEHKDSGDGAGEAGGARADTLAITYGLGTWFDCYKVCRVPNPFTLLSSLHCAPDPTSFSHSHTPSQPPPTPPPQGDGGGGGGGGGGGLSVLKKSVYSPRISNKGTQGGSSFEFTAESKVEVEEESYYAVHSQAKAFHAARTTCTSPSAADSRSASSHLQKGATGGEEPTTHKSTFFQQRSRLLASTLPAGSLVTDSPDWLSRVGAVAISISLDGECWSNALRVPCMHTCTFPEQGPGLQPAHLMAGSWQPTRMQVVVVPPARPPPTTGQAEFDGGTYVSSPLGGMQPSVSVQRPHADNVSVRLELLPHDASQQTWQVVVRGAVDDQGRLCATIPRLSDLCAQASVDDVAEDREDERGEHSAGVLHGLVFSGPTSDFHHYKPWSVLRFATPQQSLHQGPRLPNGQEYRSPNAYFSPYLRAGLPLGRFLKHGLGFARVSLSLDGHHFVVLPEVWPISDAGGTDASPTLCPPACTVSGAPCLPLAQLSQRDSFQLHLDGLFLRPGELDGCRLGMTTGDHPAEPGLEDDRCLTVPCRVVTNAAHAADSNSAALEAGAIHPACAPMSGFPEHRPPAFCHDPFVRSTTHLSLANGRADEGKDRKRRGRKAGGAGGAGGNGGAHSGAGPEASAVPQPATGFAWGAERATRPSTADSHTAGQAGGGTAVDDGRLHLTDSSILHPAGLQVPLTGALRAAVMRASRVPASPVRLCPSAPGQATGACLECLRSAWGLSTGGSSSVSDGIDASPTISTATNDATDNSDVGRGVPPDSPSLSQAPCGTCGRTGPPCLSTLGRQSLSFRLPVGALHAHGVGPGASLRLWLSTNRQDWRPLDQQLLVRAPSFVAVRPQLVCSNPPAALPPAAPGASAGSLLQNHVTRWQVPEATVVRLYVNNLQVRPTGRADRWVTVRLTSQRARGDLEPSGLHSWLAWRCDRLLKTGQPATGAAAADGETAEGGNPAADQEQPAPARSSSRKDRGRRSRKDDRKAPAGGGEKAGSAEGAEGSVEPPTADQLQQQQQQQWLALDQQYPREAFMRTHTCMPVPFQVYDLPGRYVDSHHPSFVEFAIPGPLDLASPLQSAATDAQQLVPPKPEEVGGDGPHGSPNGGHSPAPRHTPKSQRSRRRDSSSTVSQTAAAAPSMPPVQLEELPWYLVPGVYGVSLMTLQGQPAQDTGLSLHVRPSHTFFHSQTPATVPTALSGRSTAGVEVTLSAFPLVSALPSAGLEHTLRRIHTLKSQRAARLAAQARIGFSPASDPTCPEERRQLDQLFSLYRAALRQWHAALLPVGGISAQSSESTEAAEGRKGSRGGRRARHGSPAPGGAGSHGTAPPAGSGQTGQAAQEGSSSTILTCDQAFCAHLMLRFNVPWAPGASSGPAPTLAGFFQARARDTRAQHSRFRALAQVADDPRLLPEGFLPGSRACESFNVSTQDWSPDLGEWSHVFSAAYLKELREACAATQHSSHHHGSSGGGSDRGGKDSGVPSMANNVRPAVDLSSTPCGGEGEFVVRLDAAIPAEYHAVRQKEVEKAQEKHSSRVDKEVDRFEKFLKKAGESFAKWQRKFQERSRKDAGKRGRTGGSSGKSGGSSSRRGNSRSSRSRSSKSDVVVPEVDDSLRLFPVGHVFQWKTACQWGQQEVPAHVASVLTALRAWVYRAVRGAASSHNSKKSRRSSISHQRSRSRREEAKEAPPEPPSVELADSLPPAPAAAQPTGCYLLDAFSLRDVASVDYPDTAFLWARAGAEAGVVSEDVGQGLWPVLEALSKLAHQRHIQTLRLLSPADYQPPVLRPCYRAARLERGCHLWGGAVGPEDLSVAVSRDQAARQTQQLAARFPSTLHPQVTKGGLAQLRESWARQEAGKRVWGTLSPHLSLHWPPVSSELARMHAEAFPAAPAPTESKTALPADNSRSGRASRDARADRDVRKRHSKERGAGGGGRARNDTAQWTAGSALPPPRSALSTAATQSPFAGVSSGLHKLRFQFPPSFQDFGVRFVLQDEGGGGGEAGVGTAGGLAGAGEGVGGTTLVQTTATSAAAMKCLEKCVVRCSVCVDGTRFVDTGLRFQLDITDKRKGKRGGGGKEK